MHIDDRNPLAARLDSRRSSLDAAPSLDADFRQPSSETGFRPLSLDEGFQPSSDAGFRQPSRNEGFQPSRDAGFRQPNSRFISVGAFALAVLVAGSCLLTACSPRAPRPVEPQRTETPAAPPEPAAPVCYDCFWQYQPENFREELARWYEGHPSRDPLIDADRKYLLARVHGDRQALCEARRTFEGLRDSVSGPSRRLLVEETIAFTTDECGGDLATSFGRASGAAEVADQQFKANAYRQLAVSAFKPVFGEVEIRTSLAAPAGVKGYVLGESAIRVDRGERIGVQVERTVRDWLSYQLAWDFSQRPPARDELIEWHEGARLRDVMQAVQAEIVPLSGTLVARSGNRWLAPDENGVFRFEVIPDKIEYPTTRAYKDVALLVDTHGIAALTGSAVRAGVPLVVGCCDTPYKAQAAWWLASRGVNVYFPCDRYVGSLLGYEGTGTLLGSAPVRAENGRAVIGDRPVRFSVAETVVVEDAHLPGVLQYYDAPGRYFRRLGEALPLKLEIVEIGGPGQALRVVRRAEETGAQAIAVRVWNEEDAGPVRAWLAGSPKRRAVLFHTAPYPAGYALYREFPRQTTFGDPRPRFLTE